MNRISRTAAAAVAATLFCTAAWAQEISGFIMNIDLQGMTITLGNGQTYKILDLEMMRMLSLGDRVILDYSSDNNGLLVAMSIKIAA